VVEAQFFGVLSGAERAGRLQGNTEAQCGHAGLTSTHDQDFRADDVPHAGLLTHGRNSHPRPRDGAFCVFADRSRLAVSA
jgi:hypothetical protein